ncbi:MAG: class I SAM-dependent methyltransferase [Magnetococcales bacterium]|nr:class I SAM-dependent methyltransferase [Magnetococcales bacterium]
MKEYPVMAAPCASLSPELALPAYLQETYWWAYIHPSGVRFFERQWLVNCILWGNFARLRNAALAEMGTPIQGKTLQVACVYGNLTPKLADRLAPGAKLHVVDVAPVQLDNLARKLGGRANVQLHHQDSTQMRFPDGSFDQVLVFFLLHEQPAGVREQTVAEALRVVRPGGKAIFVDYHCPTRINPFRYIMIPILTALEPFAMDTWKTELSAWIPPEMGVREVRKETYFGGLYQKIVVIR